MDNIAWSTCLDRGVELLGHHVPVTDPIFATASELREHVSYLEASGYLDPSWRDEWPHNIGWFFPLTLRLKTAVNYVFALATGANDRVTVERIKALQISLRAFHQSVQRIEGAS